MERFCEARAQGRCSQSTEGSRASLHIRWRAPAWPAAWEIVLPQVPASLQTFVAQGALSSLFFSLKPQESLGTGDNAALFQNCGF